MPTSLFLSSKMFNFKKFSSLLKSRQAPLVTSFPFFFFSSHLNNSFITKYREDYDFSMVIKYNSFIIKEFNLLNLCLQLCWIHTHTHILHMHTHLSFDDVQDSYFSRSLFDSGTVEIIGPIASIVEDVMLV